MAKRDPNTTARNKCIEVLKNELKTLLPMAMAESGKKTESSLNGYIGSKADDFIDLKHDVICTPDEYVHAWLSGMNNHGKRFKTEIQKDLENKNKPNFKKYLLIFLRRGFLNHYSELAKNRPHTNDAEIWFGVNDAHYGLLVTPRWNGKEWENDKSEIRAVNYKYWTIGHVLEVGLCIPDEDEKHFFKNVDDYLQFFYSQVRITKSIYQKQIAKKYMDYVRSVTMAEDTPLLIPELRFDGSGRKHRYRLDFFTTNPFTMDKIGFELSPWSSHGLLQGNKKTLIQINAEALENFEREILKSRAYYKRYKIPILHYSNSDLANLDNVWKEMLPFLNPGEPPRHLEMKLYNEYFEGI